MSVVGEALRRGAVTERPWGVTIAELAHAGATGQLVVIADGKRYAIAFTNGMIVGALSPAASDSVGRIALTTHLVSSTQVAEITRRIAAQPERDEIEVISEVARLTEGQSEHLRRRVIAQRAARTFALESGTYAFDDKITLPVIQTDPVFPRAVVYQGARMHVAEGRLTTELRQLGARFALKLESTDELPRFAFGDDERVIVEALRAGASVADLELAHRDLDPRMIAAVIYTLAVFGACVDSAVGPPALKYRGKSATTGQPPREALPDELPSARTVTAGRAPLVNQRVTTKDRIPASPQPRAQTVPGPQTMRPPAVAIPSGPVVSRTMTPQPAVSRTMTPPPLAAGSSPSLSGPAVTIPPAVPRTLTPQPRASSEHPVVSRTLTPQPRASTENPTVARVPTPKKRAPTEVPSAGRTPTPRSPRAVSAEHPVISRTVTPPAISRSPTLDPQSTTETPAVARTVTGAPPNVPRVPTADKLDARDAFQRGEMAMRRDQVAQAVPEFARAVELQPEEPEYCAMYAWAKFCCAADKQAVAEETRKALARVLARESDSVTARMCLGRVERMLGRDKEALREFEKVLAVQPHHAAAQSEARVLEARLRR